MTDDPLSITFAALADPTRRAILARLAEGEATVSELAEPFAMSLQAISKHLKVLERAGLDHPGQGRPVATVPAGVRSARARRRRGSRSTAASGTTASTSSAATSKTSNNAHGRRGPDMTESTTTSPPSSAR